MDNTILVRRTCVWLTDQCQIWPCGIALTECCRATGGEAMNAKALIVAEK